MDQNKTSKFTPPVLTVSDIPTIDNSSASDGWGMGEVLFDLNRWSLGETDIE